MKTKFAPAERESGQIISKQFELIRNDPNITSLLKAIPNIAAILNSKRQIVFSNDDLIEFLGITDINEIIGKRVGESINCINAGKEEGGCGTTDNCIYCGAAYAIINAINNNEKTIRECRVISKKNNELIAYDFKVTTIPVHIENEKYILFNINDISNEKRKEVLEHIFFHDILNKTGSLYGLIDMLQMHKDITHSEHLLDIIKNLSFEINEEIIGQRQLMNAENKELELEIKKLNTYEIIKSVVDQIKHHLVAVDKQINIDLDYDSFFIETDLIILKRILINMSVNALEASAVNNVIIIGVNKKEKDKARFWVKNKSVIPENIKLQVFQRSFSTKGSNRGIGTYSMKLLGEDFLKGKVNFESDKVEGTTFFIDVPIKFPKKK